MMYTVNARDLHAFLEVGKDFSNWIKAQIDRARLAENRDYIIFAQKGENSGRGRSSVEYHLTIEAGKHIAMLSKEESQLKNAMKLLLKDGKNGQHFEAAKERYIRLKSDERIVNIAMDLDPKGFEFWVKEFSNDCEIINNLIK